MHTRNRCPALRGPPPPFGANRPPPEKTRGFSAGCSFPWICFQERRPTGRTSTASDRFDRLRRRLRRQFDARELGAVAREAASPAFFLRQQVHRRAPQLREVLQRLGRMRELQVASVVVVLQQELAAVLEVL